MLIWSSNHGVPMAPYLAMLLIFAGSLQAGEVSPQTSEMAEDDKDFEGEPAEEYG